MTKKPDPFDFPVPHTWATYIWMRNPSFKTHSDLGKAKNAVGSKFKFVRGKSPEATFDCWVYEWVDDEDGARWVERFEILKGDSKDTHPLWKFRVPRSKAKLAQISEKAMEKTIASIMRAVPDE